MSNKSKVALFDALIAKQRESMRTLPDVPEYAKAKVEKNIRKRDRKIKRLAEEIHAEDTEHNSI
jgi:hypothetical protein